ncbi:hypothetical protein L917_09575, partial [Phytophthora nicotianae]
PQFRGRLCPSTEGQAKRLTRAEKATVATFMVDQDRAADEKQAYACTSFVDRIQKRRRLK